MIVMSAIFQMNSGCLVVSRLTCQDCMHYVDSLLKQLFLFIIFFSNNPEAII